MFTKTHVEVGKQVTLEHAPPDSLGGKIVCLTCADCNNKASRLDRLAKIDQKAKDDHLAGRGTRVEVDFFGAGIVSGYVRPKDAEMAARLAAQPVPTSINQLKGGVMKLPPLPIGPDLDVKKGLRFRIRTPNPHHVSVSWLRSAYLLVFSLLGQEGYRYAKSPALGEIREQIMNPDVIRVGNGLSGEFTGSEFPIDPVIMLFHAHEPAFWVVKMGGRTAALPCGGSAQRFRQLTRKPIEASMAPEDVAYWASRQFRSESVLSFDLRREDPVKDLDLIGGRLVVETKEGGLWEWMIVDDQQGRVVALPFRPKGSEQEASVMMMIGAEEYRGRKDRTEFSPASPAKLLSLTVDRPNL